MKHHSTTLRDHEGRDHAYTCAPLPFDDAFDLGLEIAAVAGGPLGEALKGLMMGATLDDAGLDETVIAQAVAGLGELPGRLLKRGGSELVARILSTCERVGEDEKGLVKQRLNTPEARTAAFGGGNMGEAIHAVRWVLTVNYGPFLTALWDDLRPHLSGLALQHGIVPPSQEEETTNESSAPTSSDLKPTERVSSIS
jgi:hypothetical protein